MLSDDDEVGNEVGVVPFAVLEGNMIPGPRSTGPGLESPERIKMKDIKGYPGIIFWDISKDTFSGYERIS